MKLYIVPQQKKLSDCTFRSHIEKNNRGNMYGITFRKGMAIGYNKTYL